jgi:hypothetical protein
MKKESLYLAATVGRLVQARPLWKNIAEGKSIKRTVAAIMAIDLGDGIGARKAGVDGPKRRAMDSVVDSIFIATGLTALWRKSPEARPYVAALALREAFVGAGWQGIWKGANKLKREMIFINWHRDRLPLSRWRPLAKARRLCD